MSRRYVMGGSRCHFNLSFFLMSLNAGNVNVEEYVKFSIFKFKMFVSLLSGSWYSGWYKPQTLQKKLLFSFGAVIASATFPEHRWCKGTWFAENKLNNFPKKNLRLTVTQQSGDI